MLWNCRSYHINERCFFKRKTAPAPETPELQEEGHICAWNGINLDFLFIQTQTDEYDVGTIGVHQKEGNPCPVTWEKNGATVYSTLKMEKYLCIVVVLIEALWE